MCCFESVNFGAIKPEKLQEIQQVGQLDVAITVQVPITGEKVCAVVHCGHWVVIRCSWKGTLYGFSGIAQIVLVAITAAFLWGPHARVHIIQQFALQIYVNQRDGTIDYPAVPISNFHRPNPLQRHKALSQKKGKRPKRFLAGGF